jgi:transcriptional regulator with XRE-family HTH domain
MKSPKEIESIRQRFQNLRKHKSEKEEIEHEAQMLMFKFLAETQKYQDIQGVNRKSLAQKIKTSASYLTQLFRGDKPLNFITLAKFQKSLGIKYKIVAIPISAEISVEDEALWLEQIDKYHVQNGYWCFRNLSAPPKNIYEEGFEEELIPENELQYDYQAIPA